MNKNRQSILDAMDDSNTRIKNAINNIVHDLFDDLDKSTERVDDAMGHTRQAQNDLFRSIFDDMKEPLLEKNRDRIKKKAQSTIDEMNKLAQPIRDLVNKVGAHTALDAMGKEIEDELERLRNTVKAENADTPEKLNEANSVEAAVDETYKRESIFLDEVTYPRKQVKRVTPPIVDERAEMSRIALTVMLEIANKAKDESVRLDAAKYLYDLSKREDNGTK